MMQWIRNLLRDDNDRKFEVWQQNARDHLHQRMAKDGDAEEILKHVARTGEMPKRRPGRPKRSVQGGI